MFLRYKVQQTYPAKACFRAMPTARRRFDSIILILISRLCQIFFLCHWASLPETRVNDNPARLLSAKFQVCICGKARLHCPAQNGTSFNVCKYSGRELSANLNGWMFFVWSIPQSSGWKEFFRSHFRTRKSSPAMYSIFAQEAPFPSSVIICIWSFYSCQNAINSLTGNPAWRFIHFRRWQFYHTRWFFKYSFFRSACRIYKCILIVSWLLPVCPLILLIIWRREFFRFSQAAPCW